MKRRRSWKLALLLVAPLVLFAITAERNSWRPRVIAIDGQNSNAYRIHFLPDGRYLSLDPSESGWAFATPTFCDLDSGTIFHLETSPPTADATGLISKSRITFGNSIYALPGGDLIARCPKISKQSLKRASGRALAEEQPIAFTGELYDGKTLLLDPEQTCDEGKIYGWDSTSGAAPQVLSALPAPPAKNAIRTFKLLADKRTLAIGDYAPGPANTAKKTRPGESRDKSHSESSHESPYLLKFWDIKAQKLVFSVAGRIIPSRVLSTPEGICAWLNESGEWEFWNYHTGRQRNKFPDAKGDWTVLCALSPDGRLLALFNTHSQAITLWDTRSGELNRTIETPGGGIVGLDFSPDNRTLAGSATGTIKLWRVR